MPALLSQLELNRCPHCRVDRPTLTSQTGFETQAHTGSNKRFWKAYVCSRCGGAVLAASASESGEVRAMYPVAAEVDEGIEERAREYLTQALATLHAPAGSIMLSASAVDAMLKDQGYTDGSLYTRIDQAKDDHLITKEMSLWAHQVRLDANDQRHTDVQAPLPNEDDARRCVEFVEALAEFLYILPERVTRGLEHSSD